MAEDRLQKPLPFQKFSQTREKMSPMASMQLAGDNWEWSGGRGEVLLSQYDFIPLLNGYTGSLRSEWQTLPLHEVVPFENGTTYKIAIVEIGPPFQRENLWITQGA